jgi:hypothetical protein
MTLGVVMMLIITDRIGAAIIRDTIMVMRDIIHRIIITVTTEIITDMETIITETDVRM